MHRALNISEILRVIFSYLSRQSCFRAALTCSAWKVPALDCLWEDINSLIPLLSILAPVSLDDDGFWSFGGSIPILIQDDRWATFTSYSARIKVVQLRKRPLMHFHSSVWISIGLCKPFAWALPNLHTLKMTNTSGPSGATSYFAPPDIGDVLAVMLFCLGPRIRYFRWRSVGDEENEAEFGAAAINAVGIRSPGLTRLDLTIAPPETMRAALQTLPDLVYLHLLDHGTDSVLWGSVSALPLLRTLIVDRGDRRCLRGSDDGGFPPQRFPNLEVIRTNSVPERFWSVAFLDNTGRNCYPAVQEVVENSYWYEGDRPSHEERVNALQLALGTVFRVFPHASSVQIAPETEGPSVTRDVVDDTAKDRGRLVVPPMKSLTKLRLHFRHFSVEELESVLQAAPNLTRLELTMFVPKQAVLPITCLDLFARYTPSIKYIRIPVDDTVPPSDDGEVLEPLLSLERLLLEGCHIDDAPQCAAYLVRRTNPGIRLNIISSSCHGDRERCSQRLWKDVRKLIHGNTQETTLLSLAT